MFANILRTQAITALASWRTITPIISRHSSRGSMQLLSHRTLSQPLSTSSVLRNENVSDEPMRRNNDFRPRNQPSTTLYVGNIPYNAEVSEIRELFAPYGPIQDVRMGASLCFGCSFVLNVVYQDIAPTALPLGMHTYSLRSWMTPLLHIRLGPKNLCTSWVVT